MPTDRQESENGVALKESDVTALDGVITEHIQRSLRALTADRSDRISVVTYAPGEGTSVTLNEVEICRRPAPAPPSCPDIPELDTDAIARGAADYTPTRAMLDEDWSDHVTKKG